MISHPMIDAIREDMYEKFIESFADAPDTVINVEVSGVVRMLGSPKHRDRFEKYARVLLGHPKARVDAYALAHMTENVDSFDTDLFDMALAAMHPRSPDALKTVCWKALDVLNYIAVEKVLCILHDETMLTSEEWFFFLDTYLNCSTASIDPRRHVGALMNAGVNLSKFPDVLPFNCDDKTSWTVQMTRLETHEDVVAYLAHLSPGTHFSIRVTETARHSPILETALFDYTIYVSGDGTDMELEGIVRSSPEVAAYMPLRPDATVIQRKKDRNLVYVLANDRASYDTALEKYRDHAWARVIWIPTTILLESVMYHHILPSKIKEWEHADYVGTVASTAHTKMDSMDLNGRIAEASGKHASLVAFMYRTDPLVQRAEKWHPGFASLWMTILERLGYHKDEILYPRIPSFYCNYWVCTPARMKDYIEFFKKVRHAMETIPEIQDQLWSDAKYLERGDEIAKLSKDQCMRIWGVPYYPFHPFLCERVPCFFFWHGGGTLMMV